MPSISKASFVFLTGVAQLLEVIGESRLLHGLPVISVPLDFSEIGRLPFEFNGIVRGVEADNMGVELRAYNPVYGTAGQVHEFRADKIAGRSVLIGVAFADAGLHFAFHFAHRLANQRAKRIGDTLVTGDGMDNGDGFGGRPGEVVSDSAFFPGNAGQAFAGLWIEIVT